MSDLFWPGDERAAGLLDDTALLTAMVTVEQGWLDALVAASVAPTEARVDLGGLVGADDISALSTGAEAGGNPVIGLVALLRTRTSEPTSRWLHRGLTSQDVLDTALVLCLRDATDRVEHELLTQLTRLAELAEHHRDAPMLGRTLTQHATPITVGVKLAAWITVVADAAEQVSAARGRFTVQIGGAAGTLAAAVQLSGSTDGARTLIERTSTSLALPAAFPWHTARSLATAVGDALVTCTDAWGRIAADVATLSRPEIAELAEAIGGGSSTMPHKQNPVLSILLRRAALIAPGLASTLHLAAATTVDERADGAWHAEWSTLQLLGRRTVVAAGQASDLLAGIRIDVDRMRRNLDGAVDVDAEQRSMGELTGRPPDPAHRSGLSGDITDAAIARARAIAGGSA